MTNCFSVLQSTLRLTLTSCCYLTVVWWKRSRRWFVFLFNCFSWTETQPLSVILQVRARPRIVVKWDEAPPMRQWTIEPLETKPNFISSAQKNLRVSYVEASPAHTDVLWRVVPGFFTIIRSQMARNTTSSISVKHKWGRLGNVALGRCVIKEVGLSEEAAVSLMEGSSVIYN